MTACGHPGDSVWCAGCCQRLRANLRAIPELYQRLEVDAVRATPPPQEHRGSRNPPLPVGVEVLDVLILRVEDLDGLESLGGWCRIVIEERQLRWPDYPPSTVYGQLEAACKFLEIHLTWVCEQPWVDEMAGEVNTLHRALHRAVEPEGRWKRLEIRHRWLEDGSDCDERIWVDRLDPDHAAVVCRPCEAVWYDRALAYLLDRPLSVRDAAAITGVTDKALRRALENGVLPNRGVPGAPLISLEDVWEWRRAA